MRTAGSGGGKASAELHALHGGNAEKRRSQTVFKPLKHGLSQPGGHPHSGALNHAAHGVQMLESLQNECLHPLSRSVVQNGKGLRGHGVEERPVRAQGKGEVLHISHGGQVSPHMDAVS